MSMAASARHRSSALEQRPRLPARGGSTRIRRFNGLTRRTNDWDGLRKDDQLWFEDGDCFVHFNGYGSSQRGPSLKIPFKDVEKLDSTYLVNECLRIRKSGDRGHSTGNRTDIRSRSSLPIISETDAPRYDLFIPSPRDLSRDEAFAFHLSTRNFFAYAVGRSVVGERLSSALAGLWERLREWAQKATSASDLIAYLDGQGYLNFAENPEHALACLKFAESAKIRDVWIDAFAHCAGMHERLFLSPEYPGLSNTTNALITRASLEMDLHIARVVRAVSSFLEEELGTEHLGLSKPARDHLDHFRSFLHSYYVDKMGYFPPRESNPWNKRPWKAMHHDFRCLYDYLVDVESTCDMTSAKALTGGICVIQNLQAYNQRHGYDSLLHPLPLLPQQPKTQRRKPSQRGLRSLALVSGMSSVPERKSTTSHNLATATNCLDEKVMLCQLVQEYQRFERQRLAVKLDATEARKIRWILIYSVLQMLASIMRSPKEVRDVEKPSYPLCVLIAGCPPWVENEKTRAADLETPDPPSTTLAPDAMDALEGRTSRISIHPDCEADNAEDFFASLSGSRTDINSSAAVPAPSRFSTPLARTASIRLSMHSSVQALHKSVVGSLSRRTSLRRETSRSEVRKTTSFCEILIEDCNQQTGDADQDLYSPTVEQYEEHVSTLANSALQEFDFGLAGATGEPVLESEQLYEYCDDMDEQGIATRTTADSDNSPRDSYFSNGSGYPTSSHRSSLEESDIPDTDLSSCEHSSGATESDNSMPSTPIDALIRWESSAPSKPARYRESYLAMMPKPASVNVGCYVPTGMMMKLAPKSALRFAHRRSHSGHSHTSNASSVYPEESVQAADIADVGYKEGRSSKTYERNEKVYIA